MTSEERDALILEMRRNKATQEQIAARLGVTQQRVSQKLVCLEGRKRRDANGRPCPECGMGSRTIKTWPPGKDCTKRKHRCVSCRHEWTSRQYDDK